MEVSGLKKKCLCSLHQLHAGNTGLSQPRSRLQTDPALELGHSLLVEVEAAAVRHADDLGVGGEGAAVQGATPNRHLPAAIP